MKLRISQLSVRLNYTEADVIKAVCRQLRCKADQLTNLEILRRSLDARKKDRLPTYTLSVEVDHRGKPPHQKPGRVEKAPKPEPSPVFPDISAPNPPIVIGAGPAGLMAADAMARAGLRVTVFERMPSAGRKFLMAGRGGLDLTHSDPIEVFLQRYAGAAPWLGRAIEQFPPNELRAWAERHDEETFVGSSGRVFPKSFKASPKWPVISQARPSSTG